MSSYKKYDNFEQINIDDIVEDKYGKRGKVLHINSCNVSEILIEFDSHYNGKFILIGAYYYSQKVKFFFGSRIKVAVPSYKFIGNSYITNLI